MKGSIGFRRNIAFVLLLGLAVGFSQLLRFLGVPLDLCLAFMFVPVLAVYLWDRSITKNRLCDMGLPTSVFAIFFGVTGFFIERTGTACEFGYVIGLVGTIASLGWIFALILTLFGPPASNPHE